MPYRSAVQDSPFLFVGFDNSGKIATTAVYYSLPHDADRAAKARALILGFPDYKSYRIRSASNGDIDFEPML